MEGQTGLYVFFKRVCDTYDLLPAEAYKLPPEAEGLEAATDARPPPPTLLKPTKTTSILSRSSAAEEDFSNIPPTNTRRHIRGSPSVGTAVATVMEADDEEAEVTQKLEEMDIQDDNSVIEVPVVVEMSDDEEKEEIESGQEPEAVEDIKKLEVPLEDSDEQRPKTAYLDKGFPEALDDRESTAGTQETLVDEKVGEKLKSLEVAGAAAVEKPEKEQEETTEKDDHKEEEPKKSSHSTA